MRIVECVEALKLFREEGIYLLETDDALKHILDCKNSSCIDAKIGILELLEAVVWKRKGKDEQAMEVFCEGVKKIDSALKIPKLIRFFPYFN